MFVSINYNYTLHYWNLGKVAFITTGLEYSYTYGYQIQEPLWERLMKAAIILIILKTKTIKHTQTLVH